LRIEIVSIPTPTEPLDGLWYLPDDGHALVAALLFHGNCHNFYTGPSRFLPDVLTARGIGCLAFNRRGHDMVTSLTGRSVGGGSFQMAAEALEDNRLAADFLAAKGYQNPIVIGHSNGGMLASQHCADNYGEPRALIMMSAHCGGRNNVLYTSQAGMFARDRLPEFTELAQAMVDAGRGRELILLPDWWWVISAESFLDRCVNTPDTVANAARVRCPSLAIRGSREEPRSFPAEAFAANATAPCDLRVLPDCDHFYTGHEQETAVLVADWLSHVCNDVVRPA
jgi:pimeloyl-ACP methyl ester carboxylesterase